MFVFVNWLKEIYQDEDFGFTPDYQEGWRLDVMTHGLSGQWLVAECWPDDPDKSLPSNYTRVPKRLGHMLQSCKRFPAALALARRRLRREKMTTPEMSREAYAEALADAIEIEFRQQKHQNFILARASENCLIGYLFAGQYAWVIGYDSETKKVLWVTDDYEIYDSPCQDFLLDSEDLERLPNVMIGRRVK